MFTFVKTWFSDFWKVFSKEFKGLFTDEGVLIIFLIGGLGYPLLYNIMYHNGVVADTPVAVVDMSDCQLSRRFIRKVDATRELAVVAKCVTMEEARRLMQERKVNGIILFPSDFGDRIIANQTAKLSIYADMSSFIYYKNLLMGSNFVMLDEIRQIEIERFNDAGNSDFQSAQLTVPLKYEENNPWNKAFSYTIFFISAALLIVIQQTMFYGMSLRAGTMREEENSFALQASHIRGRGMGRIVLGRAAVYWLLYMGIGMYVAMIVPAIFGIPQRGSFIDILILLLVFVTDCVFFCQFWSSFITRRESVIVLLLFMSPIIMFLTGFSWPETAFPVVWKYFSYIFPSTFGARAFINLNTAGGDLSTVRELIWAMTLQAGAYYFAENVAVKIENALLVKKKRAVSLSDAQKL